jgi:hypothetical protein
VGHKIKTKNKDGRLRTFDVSNLASLGERKAKELTAAANSFVSKYSDRASAASKLKGPLSQLGLFNESHPVHLSTPEETYNALHDFRKYFFKEAFPNSSLFTVNSSWLFFSAFVKYCMDEQVLPETMIPPGSKKLNNGRILKKHKHETIRKSDDPWDRSGIISLSLSRTDTEYLDQMLDEHQKCRDALLNCALKEINTIKEGFEEGERLAAKVNISELLSAIKSSETKKIAGADYSLGFERAPFFLSPRHPLYRENTLSYLKNHHHGILQTIDKAGYHLTRDQHLARACRSGERHKDMLSMKELRQLSGCINARELVPFFVYILIKNPSFRPASLHETTLTDKHGLNSFFVSAGEDGDRQKLSIIKARARSEKTSIQCHEDEEIIELLIKLTAPYRGFHEHHNTGHEGRLWQDRNSTYSSKSPTSYKSISVNFSGPKDPASKRELITREQSFMYSHSELEPYRSTATLSQLPRLQGIITWLTSGGDLSETSRVLGNTTSVARNHYIPQPIQDLMNERTIRRFQNLIICASTADSPNMLEATDFCSECDLNDFLSQMIDLNANHPNGALAAKMRQKDAAKPSESNKSLCLSISVPTLSVLFLYEEHVTKKTHTPTEKQKFWVELSRSLKLLLPQTNTQRELRNIFTEAVSGIAENRQLISFPEDA